MFSLLAVLALATGASARESFIVGGGPVDIADHPWQGSYRTATPSHTCGCIFIGGAYALTAAHCGGSTAYTMEFGATDRTTGKIFSISTVTIHPEYDTGAGFVPNDITVVEATEAITGTNIDAAKLAPNSINPLGNGWITGWGRTCGSCDLPTTLQGTEIEIITDAQCAEIWGESFQDSSMICVWDGENGSTGACNGDSGGPMTQDGTVYGIASWVASGCLSNFPSTYSRVGAFYEWVCDETNNQGNGC